MSTYMDYLARRQTALRQEERALAAAQRKDEADLTKIRINVYGICQTVHTALEQALEPEAFPQKYLEKLDGLPGNWRAALEKAREHGDVERIVIETIKLETLAEIRAVYLTGGERHD